jgi:ATP-dependent Clp protease, protease subunit
LGLLRKLADLGAAAVFVARAGHQHEACQRLVHMTEINDRLLNELVDAVRDILRKEQSDRLRDVYLIGDIDKDSAKAVIEKLRELANESPRPITLYVNSAGGNVTDGLALHDAIRHLVSRGVEVTIIVQGMAYSMGSVVVQAASAGRRLAFPHSWIMIHEPAKWAGWQSTTAAAQHLDRLKQMQSQIYRILAERSGKPLRQIIRDTKRTDFYLDAVRAKEYGLIDGVVGQVERLPSVSGADARLDIQTTETPTPQIDERPPAHEAAQDRSGKPRPA